MGNKSRLWIASMVMLIAVPAAADTVYKLVDRNGKVTYSEAPPKSFDGTVTRMDIDPEANKATLNPRDAQDRNKSHVSPKGQDLLEQRRTTRAALESRLAAARAKLEAAKEALANASPGDDETQTIQQQTGPAGQIPGAPAGTSSGGGLGVGGMYGMAPRSNCTTNAKTKVTTCAGSVNNAKYAERIATLEAAVKRAELEVEEAERAYRQGVE